MRRSIFFLGLVAVLGCNSGITGVSAGGTFVVSVGTEQFRVRINNPLLATQARRMMNGVEKQQIINAEIDRGDGGFNTGYHWHMKPETVQFAEVTTEVCSGRPSDVESNINYWVDTVKRYCPWGGRIIREVERL